ncbi:hypothetical protein SISNIDRAFT_482825 [Sistotremastrum niveocremeum HHB9708]|uniref:F-box domain-containing protein n=1 Tax=Sistotremastrum niveocremeum HHB9708 TaxID=1314777 RepID=A0A164XS29_9AGAM|nr:hypothetical protein SISNIDRAFT_482825 [Sistotremastrum niveocremeum HHB9708]
MVVRTFLSLAEELIIMILCHLDTKDIDSCSRRLREVTKRSSLLKHLVRLRAARVDDLSLPYTSLPERWAKLRSREEAWTSTKWYSKQTLQLGSPFGAYEMEGGVFACSPEGSSCLQFTVLSTVGSPAPQSWQHDLDGMELADFTFDCDQDLLCMVERSTQRHGVPLSDPLAKPVGEQTTSLGGRMYPTLSLIIYDDLVGCLYQLLPLGGSDVMTVWNWRTGQELWTIDSGDDRYMDFTFLSRPAVMLCSVVTPSFKFVTWEPENPSQVTTITLGLPPVGDDSEVGRLQCHSNPAPNRRRRSLTSNPYKSSISFVPSSEDRILAFSCTVLLPLINDTDSDLFYMLFISASELEKSISKWLTSARAESVGHETQGDRLLEVSRCWESWGPEITRWIPDARPFGWAVCSRGLRFACSDPYDEGDSRRIMTIDFNPHNFPEGVADEPQAGVTMYDTRDRLISRLSGLDAFTEPVISSLPCVIRTSIERVHDSMGVMMNDDYIVAMQVGTSSNISKLEILNMVEAVQSEGSTAYDRSAECEGSDSESSYKK